MKITPQDIHHKEFKRSVRGYNEEEVDIFLDQVTDSFEKIYKQNINYEEEIQKLRDDLKKYKEMELTLKNTLLTAQKSAEEIQSNAMKESDLVISRAKVESKHMLEKAKKTKNVLSETFKKIANLENEFKTKIRSDIEKVLSTLNRIESEEENLVQSIEEEFASMPEIKVVEVNEQEVARKEMEVNRKKGKEIQKELKNKEKNDDKKNKIVSERKDKVIKADASKSDIASEKEIDKFLEQTSTGISGNNGSDDDGGFFSRIFKRKTSQNSEEDAEAINNQEITVDAADTGKEKKAKAKDKKQKNKKSKKKTKKKNTQEIVQQGANN